MKKILLFAAAAVCTLTAGAKTWRVNYDANAKADFLTLTEATSSNEFVAGDVIYVEPGIHAGRQADNVISKPCTVIGPGWGFRQSTGNDLEISAASFRERICIEASDVTITGIHSTNDVYVGKENAKNLHFSSKCKVYLTIKGENGG